MTMKFIATLAFLRAVQAACNDNADGFASLNGGTTGGNGGEEVTVTTYADLVSYAAAEGPYLIKVSGTITVEDFGEEIPVANDKTIIGVGTTGEISGGGFGLEGSSNVIIRNLIIGNTATDGSENDRDGIQADGVSNIWIDHCIFENGGDGLVDLREDTTYWTVSNNIFRNHDKTFGIGWTDNVVAEGTIHHNWFQSTNQRNPSADNLLHAHMYNNFVDGVTSYGHYARGYTNMRVENCYFQDSEDPLTADETATLTNTGSIFDNCSGTEAADQGTAFDASDFYDYTLDSAEDVPSLVQANSGPQASVCS